MTEPGKTMVSLRLSNELLEQVDQRAANLGINRSQWFTNMTTWCLENTHTIEQRGGTP